MSSSVRIIVTGDAE